MTEREPKTKSQKIKEQKIEGRKTASTKEWNLSPALSFAALLAKASIYKIIVVLTVMAAAEIALFLFGAQSGGGDGLRDVLYNRCIYPFFSVALVLVFFLLMRLEGVIGDKGRDTMRRLALSGTEIFLVEACYNFFCFLLVFTVQIWISIGMVKIFGGAGSSPQGLFLAFYRVEILHSLLPLAEIGKWMKNLLLLLAFSLGAACGFGKRDYTLPVLIVLLGVAWFITPIGFGFADLACDIFCGFGIAAGVWRAWELRNYELEG